MAEKTHDRFPNSEEEFTALHCQKSPPNAEEESGDPRKEKIEATVNKSCILESLPKCKSPGISQRIVSNPLLPHQLQVGVPRHLLEVWKFQDLLQQINKPGLPADRVTKMWAMTIGWCEKKLGNMEEDTSTGVRNNTQPENEDLELDCIPLPSGSEWVDGLPPDGRKIYNSTSIQDLPKGFCDHIVIRPLHTHEDFFEGVEVVKPSGQVTDNWPFWDPSGGGLSHVLTTEGPEASKRVAVKATKLMELVSESIQESGKWDGNGRKFLEASSMISNRDKPQSVHYDWKYKWVESQQATTKHSGSGDKLDLSGYP